MPDAAMGKPDAIVLEPMPASRFPAFAEAAAASHAADNVDIGRWAPGDAVRLARAELERLLPQGHDTPDHHFHEIVSTSSGAVVGVVLFADITRADRRVAYLLQLLVHTPYRRQGHGRNALAALEAKVRAMGIGSIALHVFGSNLAAQALYRSVGFRVTGMNMQRDLPSVEPD